jgi:hypothetical protein
MEGGYHIQSHRVFDKSFVSLGYLNWGAKTWLFFLGPKFFKLEHLLIDIPNLRKSFCGAKTFA